MPHHVWNYLAAITLLVAPMARAEKPPHFDLDMTGPEYAVALEHANRLGNGERDAEADTILAAGNRLYQWIRTVNATRPPESQLSLSEPGTLVGIPIAAPQALNLDRVKVEFQRLADSLPDEMRNVLVAGANAPAVLDIADPAFVYFGRQVERFYSQVARWQLLMPHLDWYKKRKKDDVRGYYHLYRTSDLERKLRGFATLSADDQKQLETWLLGLCGNSGAAESSCRDRFHRDHLANNLVGFYTTMRPHGEATWNTFWKTQNPRPDATWSPSRPNVLSAAFTTPVDGKVTAFLRANIEDEWKWGSWGLKLDFRSGGFGHPYIVFQAGATPHVNELGGAIITLDQNQPLEEYSVRWTIRHEFGHVLGLPDCYVEFWEESEKAFVNYQLDTSDLMCSRAGRMNQRLYDELRQAYFR